MTAPAQILADQAIRWCWRRFGDALMLVTETGGAKVVLAPARRKAAAIDTRDPKTGILRPIREDDDVARMIAAAPALRDALTAASHALRSYQYGNSATDLAQEIADACDVALALCEARS